MTSHLQGGDRAPAGHLDDAELLRLIDGASTDMVHLQSCDACATRSSTLRARRSRLAALLDEADVPAPRPPAVEEVRSAVRRRARGWPAPALQAAAVVLVAGTLMAQEPARRWIAERWDAMLGSGRHGSSAASPTPAPAAPREKGSIAFEVTPGTFTIQLDAWPSTGSLVVSAHADARVVVERSGRAADLVVMPRGVRIRSGGEDTLHYVVRVPETVTEVRLQVGALPSARDVIINPHAGRRTINLARRPGAP